MNDVIAPYTKHRRVEGEMRKQREGKVVKGEMPKDGHSCYLHLQLSGIGRLSTLVKSFGKYCRWHLQGECILVVTNQACTWAREGVWHQRWWSWRAWCVATRSSCWSVRSITSNAPYILVTMSPSRWQGNVRRNIWKL